MATPGVDCSFLDHPAQRMGPWWQAGPSRHAFVGQLVLGAFPCPECGWWQPINPPLALCERRTCRAVFVWRSGGPRGFHLESFSVPLYNPFHASF
jgi:hypothetical protein